MTIASATNKSGPYFYNGSATSFAYGFKISNEAHIRVVETVTATGVEADLVLNTDYTVTGVDADAGGNVVISPARAAGKSVVMVRNTPFTQGVVLENQGAYFAKVVEGAFDDAAARDQQLQEQISRAVLVPVSSDIDPDELIADLTAGAADAVAAAASTAADAIQTAADRVATGLDAVATAGDRVQTGIDAAAADADRITVAADKAIVAADKATVAGNTTTTNTNAGLTAADRVATAADRVQTGLDRVATGQDRVATAADRVQTGLDRTAAAASAAAVNASIISMSRRPNLSVNGSLVDVFENSTRPVLTANGSFYAEQHAMYKSGTLGVSVQTVAYASLAGGSWAGEFKCTTAKGSLGATDLITDTELIEGSRPDFAGAGWGAVGAKRFMYRKEVQKPAGLYNFHFSNSAGNRHCAVPYTITAGQANAKTVVEVVVPGDTAGTWLKTDGVIGLVVDDVLVAGSTYTGGSASTWGATAYYAATTQANFLSSTANVARHTDFGLRLDPDATGVYGAYEVGETDAVFRSERYWWYMNAIHLGRAQNATISYSGAVQWTVKMAKAPTLGAASYAVSSGAAGTPSFSASSSNMSGAFENSSNNWSGGAIISITGFINARLS